MTFEGFDAALPIEACAMIMGMPAQAIAEGGTLEDALRQAGLAEGGTGDSAILDRRAARAELTVLDLWMDRPGAPQRTAFDQLEQARGAAALLAGTALVAGGELPSGKDVAVSAATIPPQGGDYVDENGNGQWDPGEEIIVNGNRPREMDDDSDWASFWSGGNGGGGGDETGGSGVPGADHPNDCRDRNALAAKDEINAQPDDHSKEYGSVVYRDSSGQVQHSPPLPGHADSVPPEVIAHWMIHNGVSWSQVIGFAHNHDREYYGTTNEEARLNRYPSENDWDFAGWLINHGAGGGLGGAGFALYIIDTRGDLREFEYSERGMYESLSNYAKDHSSHLPHIMQDDGSSCGS